MADDQEKTEQPTSRRLEQAREEGNIPVSKEVSSFFVILGGVMVLYFAGIWMLAGTADFMRSVFTNIRADMGVEEFKEFFQAVSFKLFVILIPAFLIPLIGAISYVLQNGIIFNGKSISPKFEKINPIEGLKKLFSLSSVAELVKSLLKISILGYVVVVTVKNEMTNLPFLMDMEVAGSFAYMGRISMKIMLKTAWVLALIAIIDYLFQRWHYKRGLMMSMQEIKDELKETEGDPLIKARIKSIQRELARKRMMQEVPKADVVITNPTHIAVAIKYDKQKSSAPIVVAKGAGTVAEKIKEIAKKHRVPVIENKPLARALFKVVAVGKEIPVDMYKAVAQILAYVYSLRNRKARRA